MSPKAVELIAGPLTGITLTAALPAWLILGSLAFSFVVGSISGLMPAIRASKLNPVDALHYE